MSPVEVIDLSLPLGPGLSVEPGDPPLAFEHARTHAEDGFEVTRICLGSHSGTHVDAPRHFLPEGPTLDQFPLSRLLGPGLVIDCRAAENGIGPEHLAEPLRRTALPPQGLVLLWTAGAALTKEGAALLLEADAGLVGTDAPSLDNPPYPAHHLLLLHEVLIVENLCRLERLGPGLVSCALLPLAVVGTDGAPVRAVAWR